MERLEFKPHAFADIPSLRGVPADDCTCVEGELQLTYGGKALSIQAGATGSKGRIYAWQNVQIDHLWSNPVAQAIRAGGVVYNGDTYLWGDLYLVLFSNGVVTVAAHFTNTKLHIEGYDFQGLPVIRFSGPALDHPQSTSAILQIPAEGTAFRFGSVAVNLADSASMCSPAHPGTVTVSGNAIDWCPVSRTFNPQLPDAPPLEWARGFARTFRFQLSMGEAPAEVCRYTVPSWWYTACGEPWPGGYLPVRGRYAHVAGETCAAMSRDMVQGRFDAGNAAFGNDGDLGWGLMHLHYLTGDPATFNLALQYCYYWSDLAVDHTDFTVHQWVGGWGWKTCAYTKFRDVLFGYLETGDPALKDTVEMVAEAHWTWYRSNWPRCAIGRDNFEMGGWALLWRFLRTEHSRLRTRELVRMNAQVLRTRGTIGGQMGAGPHPGYHSSLYMTLVTMISLLDVAEAGLEHGASSGDPLLQELFPPLHRQAIRDDTEMFPSDYGRGRHRWGEGNHAMWAVAASRIYPELTRLGLLPPADTQHGYAKIKEELRFLASRAMGIPRGVMGYLNPWYADAWVTGARWENNRLLLDPIECPELWPATQTVATPAGDLIVKLNSAGGPATISFSADEEFPVVVRWKGDEHSTTSGGSVTLSL